MPSHTHHPAQQTDITEITPLLTIKAQLEDVIRRKDAESTSPRTVKRRCCYEIDHLIII